MLSEPLDRYVTTAQLGEGGTARVTAVLDPLLGRESALKRLHPHHVTDPHHVSRFHQEARVMRHVATEGIAAVHALGVDARDCPWFTMDLVRGETLSAWVRRQKLGRLDNDHLPEAIRWLANIADICQHAHDKGVVHRDLKPGNVMRSHSGRAFVIDWGAARLLPPAAQLDMLPAEPPGSVVGTPCFLSPEQARGEIDRIDARTDVFGLGALLYFVLTGQPPYAPGPAPLVTWRAASGTVCDPRRHVPVGLPYALCRLAASSLDRDRAARPWSAGHVARALRRWLGTLPPGTLAAAAA